MPASIGPFRRLAAAPVMAFGAGLTAWSYTWRVTPVHREELDGSLDEDLPVPLDPGVPQDGVQLVGDGHGPLLHRIYRGVMRDARRSPAELAEHLAADPNRVVPLALARFHKTRGERGHMRVGDEFLIRMPGPWDGPVRTVDVTPTSFRFATLGGHLEAGQIEWSAREEDGRLVFEIDSRSRGGDRVSAFLHDRIPMAKEIQLHMWTSVVEHVARESGGTLDGGVRITTRRVPPEAFA